MRWPWVTTFARDLLGRVFQTIDALTHEARTVLDAIGQVVGSVDGMQQLTQHAYDLLGRHVLTVDARGGVTEMKYDAAGRLVTLKDPAGNKTRWRYDERGDVVQEVDPLDNSRTWEYDDARRMTRQTDRLGRVIEVSYFDDGLVASETWKNTLGGSVVNTRSWTYDANNRPLTAADGSGTYTWTYDVLGRLETQQDLWGITLTNTWDAGDRLTQVADTKGGTRDYEYDNANRNTVRKFSDGTNQARLELSWSNRDQVTEVRRYADAAGTTLVGSTGYAYLDNGLVATIHHKNAAGTTLDLFDYAYDAGDRLTQETATLGPTRNYTYDVTSQLTSDGTSTWSFDLNGNRTNTGYVIGAGNRITTDGVWNYSYDAEGNRTKRVHIATGVTWVYAYDHHNRLVSAAKHSSDGGPLVALVEYEYDALGNLAERSHDADGSGPGAAVIERYAYEGANAWADLDASGNVTTRRLYLDAVDALFARIDSGGVDWYLTDRLGSVRDIMSNAGSVIDHLDYDGFGKATETSPSNGDTRKFTGRYTDSATELQNNTARWYSFDVGGWMSQDPIGFAAGDANLYRYVGNSPTNATDPSGTVHSYINQWTASWFEGTPLEETAAWAYSFGRHTDLLRTMGEGVYGSYRHVYNAWDQGRDPVVAAQERFSDNMIGGHPIYGVVYRGIHDYVVNRTRGEDVGTAYFQAAGRNAVGLSAIWKLYEGITGQTYGGEDHGRTLNAAQARDRITGGVFDLVMLSTAAYGFARGLLRPSPTTPVAPVRHTWQGPRIQSGAGQTGLRDMQVVNQIRNDMLNGQYRFTAPEGRIGGWRDAAGNYYIGEGHHRMNAALQIFEETGNATYVNQLLENGLWTQGRPPASQIGPLPRR